MGKFFRIYVVSAIVVFFLLSFYFNTAGTITGRTVDLPSADFSSEKIVMPVKVHLVKEDSGVFTSSRNEENVLRVFKEVNKIWEPAGIEFEIEEVVETELSSEAIPRALNSNARELYFHDSFNSEAINLFFSGSLGNINGITLMSINTALVADFTTVNDFRTTAHEFGHILGLGHVAPDNRLMAQGRNGEILNDREIAITRTRAVRLIEMNFYTDRTEISFRDIEEKGKNIETTVNVRMIDNNENADGDGGKISLDNAKIINIERIDWEENCNSRESFEFECIITDKTSLQWFNFVSDDEDIFRFKISFPKNEESFLTIEETGGMECGAYFQTAQEGLYTGYPDGTGGLDCAGKRTQFDGKKISELGGFPLKIDLHKI